jgi:hypothetical protein
MQLVLRDTSFEILACTLSNTAADLLVERLAAAGLSVDELLRLNARLAFAQHKEHTRGRARSFCIPKACKTTSLLHCAHYLLLCGHPPDAEDSG